MGGVGARLSQSTMVARLNRSETPLLLHRHPGLDPGSRFALGKYLSRQQVIEIGPIGVAALDQRELPLALPSLHPFLVRYAIFN
jgi:hypothetical protein